MFLSCLLKLKCWSCTFDARKENECLCSFLDKHSGEKSFAKKTCELPKIQADYKQCDMTKWLVIINMAGFVHGKEIECNSNLSQN